MASELENAAIEFGVKYFREVTADCVNPELIASLPVTWVRDRHVLPITSGGISYLLMPGVAGMDSLQHASIVSGFDLQPAFAEPGVIDEAIERAYYEGKNFAGEEHPASEAAVTGDPASDAFVKAETPDLLVDRESQPVTQFLNNVILDAVRKDASDIHFEPSAGGRMRIRFRLDGIMREQPSPPPAYAGPIISRIKVMASMDIAEKRLPQDGMAQVSVGGRIVDIRVSTVPVAEGERAVLRLLNRDRSLLPLGSLGMPDKVLSNFSRALECPNGIIIVSGPTGSGKTTTLYSALGSMDAVHRNILTIEDPIEYRLPEIGQIQVKPKIGLTFVSGLPHILRQDPDIVLVGETRDAETAEIAVRASLTGHLVFTTLHTNDAPSAVMRLTDMGIEPYLLASCLRGVLAQRLVRKVCPECFGKISAADAEQLSRAEMAVAESAHCREVAKPNGCRNCREGYAGRIGIFEFMPCDGRIAAAIHSGGVASDELRRIALESDGYSSMDEDAAGKLRSFMTTPSEVVAAIGRIRAPGE